MIGRARPRCPARAFLSVQLRLLLIGSEPAGNAEAGDRRHQFAQAFRERRVKTIRRGRGRRHARGDTAVPFGIIPVSLFDFD